MVPETGCLLVFTPRKGLFPVNKKGEGKEECKEGRNHHKGQNHGKYN